MNIRSDTLIALAFALPVLVYKILYPAHANPTLMMILTLLVFAPIAEELFFRGVVLEFLLRKNVRAWVGNIAVSIVFAVAHVLIRQEPTAALVFFPSLVLGWLYTRHRKVMPVIIVHAAYNAVVLI
jgi:membrane protease YdiL (CAAX protease family)